MTHALGLFQVKTYRRPLVANQRPVTPGLSAGLQLNLLKKSQVILSRRRKMTSNGARHRAGDRRRLAEIRGPSSTTPLAKGGDSRALAEIGSESTKVGDSFPVENCF